MVYMAADNNLTNQAITDIVEMQKARFPSSINVLVQLDPNQYHSEPQARRYKIVRDNVDFITSPVIEYLGDIDSGDYLNLSDFVNWGIIKYPARNYALVIWSHGNGWSRDHFSSDRWICPDTNSMNQISISKGELRNAFQLFQQKIDFLIIDACYMQTIEVISEVSDKTGYVVASPNLVPYEGFPYREILQNWNHYTNRDLHAMNIVDIILDSHRIGGSQNPDNFTRALSVSAAKSSQLLHFNIILQEFVEKWSHIATESFVSEARNLCYEFYTQVDLKEFFAHLLTLSPYPELNKDIESLLKTIDLLFVAGANINMPPLATTASIWYPTEIQFFEGAKKQYLNLHFADTGWLQFLEKSFEIR